MKRERVLVVASAGGHFEQMMRLRPAFAHADALYVTTLAGLAEREELGQYRLVRDCNQSTPLTMLVCSFQILGILVRFKPRRIVSTGALPGLLAIVFGRIFGARTMWIDSLANAEQLSSSGAMARRFAHVHLSQWPHVAQANGSRFEGRVL